MLNFIKPILFLLLSCLMLDSCFAQQDSTKTERKKPFIFSASYIGDLISNYSGGIKHGTEYLGLANLKVGFDTQKAGLWKNGFLFVNVANTHGGEPSATLVGDFQGISNIEAGNLSFLYEFWYRQSIQNVTVTLGLQDLNALFAVNETGTSFVNSSFGILSSIADNIPAPIFPLTALGVSVQWNIGSDYVWQNSIFDGTPDNFETNPYNIDWKLSRNDGMTLVSEFQIGKSVIKGLKGCYKFGAYYHEHNHAEAEVKKNYGFYFLANQQIFRKKDDTGGLSLFTQIGLCPRNTNKNSRYYSLGANYQGLFNKRPLDEAGIAFAYAGFSHNVAGNETAIELHYQLKISDNIFIKPDLQYVIHPAGTDTKLKNALVSLFRLGISF